MENESKGGAAAEGRRPSFTLKSPLNSFIISFEFFDIFDVFSGNTQRVLWLLENQPAHPGWVKTSQRSLAR